MPKNWRLLLSLALLGLVLSGLMLLTGCSTGQTSGGGTAPSGSGDAGTPPPAQQTQETKKEKPFYEGKTITLIVATKPGGGYDSYARLIAPYVEKNLPGSTIIVKNVPGAGHIIGANEIYTAKPDGLTFGTFNKGLITGQISQLEGIRFDLTKMSWLGNLASEPRVFVLSTKSSFANVEEIIKGKKTLNIASSGLGTAAYNDAKMIEEILGLKNMKLLTGYEGTEGEMAMMRGDVDGQIASVDSAFPLVQSGDVRIIMVINSKKLKVAPDAPLVYDFARPDRKSLVDFMVSQALISRPYAGPPDIPEDRAKVLREAFSKAASDPNLLADAEKSGRPIDFADGEEVAQLVSGALNQPPEVIKLIRDITAESK